MKLEYLYRGLAGHPLHPPLTDVAIGAYTFATVAAVLSALEIAAEEAAQAWALALVVGLVAGAAAALTGFVDWLRIERGTPLWRTATAHMVAQLFATAAFLIAIGAGYSEGMDGVITDAAFVLTVIGFALLTLGGWLGGSLVFVHGMRVLNLVEEPARRAASPIPQPEKEAADR